MHIFVDIDANDAEKNVLRDLAANDTLSFGHPTNPSEADKKAFLQAEVAFGWCPPEWFTETNQLRWMQLNTVGFGEYLRLDWQQLGKQITVTNLRGVASTQVAETILAGLLALHRGIDQLVMLKTQQDWQKMALRPQLTTLTGSRVLLVGYGSIARRLRELLQPFDCTIVTYAKNSPDSDLHSLSELDAQLESADVVCCILPDAADTRGLMGRARLARLKPTALFVNAGRGSLVDENALVDALMQDQLGGCVLDVTQQEPLPVDHPLWSCPRTILTQHTAGGSARENSDVIALFAHNLARYRAGEALKNVVNWQKGY